MTRSKVDRYLASVEQSFGGLPAVVARREERAQAGAEGDDHLADRLAFQDEWWDQIDRLETLCVAYTAAEMNDAQLSRFEPLCAKVLEQLPLIVQLDLRIPSVSTVETLRRVIQNSVMAKGA